MGGCVTTLGPQFAPSGLLTFLLTCRHVVCYAQDRLALRSPASCHPTAFCQVRRSWPTSASRDSPQCPRTFATSRCARQQLASLDTLTDEEQMLKESGMWH